MSESAAQAPCAICLKPAPRVIGAPQLNLMSANNRYAETRNEKSAHEPDVVHTLAPHGHSHSHSGSPLQTGPLRHKHAGGHSHRPWMIGH